MKELVGNDLFDQEFTMGGTVETKDYAVLEVFFEIGDCSFASNGHHGTPNQRMNAAIFGYNLANDTNVNGVIMTAEEFILLQPGFATEANATFEANLKGCYEDWE